MSAHWSKQPWVGAAVAAARAASALLERVAPHLGEGKLGRAASFSGRLLHGIGHPDRISTVVLLVSSKCNARCGFCFDTDLPHLEADGPTPPGSPKLTLDEYQRIADHLPRLHQIMLGGGEPFLRTDIDRIAEAFYQRSDVRLISIPTNGSLRHRTIEKVTAIAERCPRATINLQVSIDAVGAKHDSLRVLPGCFDSAVALVDDLLRLSERLPNLNPVVSTAVTASNVDEVADLCVYLHETFGGRLRYHNIQYDQRLGAGLMDDPALREKLLAIEERWVRGGGRDIASRLIQRYYVGFINALIFAQLEANRMLYRCNAGRKLCVVMPDGRVSPCEPFVFEPRYADLPRFSLRDYDYDIARVARDPRYRELLSFIERGACEACPWSCAAIASMTFSPANWPLIARGYAGVGGRSRASTSPRPASNARTPAHAPSPMTTLNHAFKAMAGRSIDGRSRATNTKNGP